jgi:hypothetical protein
VSNELEQAVRRFLAANDVDIKRVTDLPRAVDAMTKVLAEWSPQEPLLCALYNASSGTAERPEVKS